MAASYLHHSEKGWLRGGVGTRHCGTGDGPRGRVSERIGSDTDHEARDVITALRSERHKRSKANNREDVKLWNTTPISKYPRTNYGSVTASVKLEPKGGKNIRQYNFC